MSLMLHTKFHQILPVVPGKKILKRFTIYEGHPINSGNFFIIRMLIRLAYQSYIVSMAKHVAHILHYP